jgi:hypothetical protein
VTNDSKASRAVRAVDRVALNIFNGIKSALGLHRLNRLMARRDAAANLQLALVLARSLRSQQGGSCRDR